MNDPIPLLDQGYLQLVESWGSDEAIVCAARMSTGKGFLGWGDAEKPGDEKLLRYLWEHKHATPFEMAGLVIEVKAPIMVFREWHRHRTQCLAPDTLVHCDVPSKKNDRYRIVNKIPIEDIWRRWQPTLNERPQYQVNAFRLRSRLAAMRLRCLNEDTKEFGYTGITDVIRGEPKRMVRVRTFSEHQLTATRDHKVFTSNGWMTLGLAIETHSLLAMEGVRRDKPRSWEPPVVDESLESWAPVTGWLGLYEVSDMGRVRRVGRTIPKCNSRLDTGYAVVSLNRSGGQISRTVHSLVMEAFVGARPSGMDVRHGNHNRFDARLENLSYGTAQENARDSVDADRYPRLVPVFEKIESVQDAGYLPTYDLAVAGPWHNFVADGFVVHNSYNEMSGRYVSLPNENYMPTVERLLINSKTNKQAGTIKGAAELTAARAEDFRNDLFRMYRNQQALYERALASGVPKELARVHLPVGRYSRMRASANLRNWLAFLTLRMDPAAQYEIRMYANALGTIIEQIFPRTWQLFSEG